MYPTYHITGAMRSGTRFRIVTSNYSHAMGINLWRGSVWGVASDGKRKLLKRVQN